MSTVETDDLAAAGRTLDLLTTLCVDGVSYTELGADPRRHVLLVTIGAEVPRVRRARIQRELRRAAVLDPAAVFHVAIETKGGSVERYIDSSSSPRALAWRDALLALALVVAGALSAALPAALAWNQFHGSLQRIDDVAAGALALVLATLHAIVAFTSYVAARNAWRELRLGIQAGLRREAVVLLAVVPTLVVAGFYGTVAPALTAGDPIAATLHWFAAATAGVMLLLLAASASVGTEVARALDSRPHVAFRSAVLRYVLVVGIAVAVSSSTAAFLI